MIRSMVESRTYRQSCVQKRHDVDPANRLRAGMNIRRLDAETIRDSMLAASGELQLQIGGNSIKEGTAADYGYADSSFRRSVYVPVLRNALSDFRTVFDYPTRAWWRANELRVASLPSSLSHESSICYRAGSRDRATSDRDK